ncbi:MAG TPA: PIN domain-containing protein [Pyrinomonadaceae bacterium]|nr:PIN domain-containing protein [Pyrinomonadaceae bacterium]
MGTLTLPASGIIYLDTAPIIYSVEKHSDYWPLLRPMWESSSSKQIEIISSDLALLETLVGPLKKGDNALVQDYEQLLTATEVRLMPITASILREAARLRATLNFKTPDAIHAASALAAGCVQFITNDTDFRRVQLLPVTILKEVLGS